MAVFFNDSQGLSGTTTNKHKVLQKWLMIQLDKKLNGEFVLMESAIRNGRKERVPDVTVWAEYHMNDDDVALDSPLLTIEITHTTQNDKDARESIADVFKMSDTVQESFIYNYKKQAWTRFKRNENGVVEGKSTDYSAMFSVYLDKLLVISY